MKRRHFPFLSGKLGVSYTISAVVMTACTITLVIVASVYAFQVLEQQRGAAEFNVAKKSILAFNDALENTAWKPKAVQSARFTLNYGLLELIPCTELLSVNVSVGTFSYTTPPYSTGLVRYYTKTKYANFGEGYKSYILGDESLLVTGSTESYGRALIAQSWDRVNITLSYRVRAMRTSVININSARVNYVDIWIIKVVVGAHSFYVGDFDLKAKCLNVNATSIECPTFVGDENCTVSVQFGSETPSSAPIALVAGKVVFNFVVAEVQVTL